MRSGTSCCNATLYKKNLTRFAPAWALYTLCLILGILLTYTNGGMHKYYHFAANMGDLIQYMGIVNMFYAPIAASLLFGDLYNSRMCNALHAMPVKRKTLFYTNLLSGITVSLIPTFIMAVLATALVSGSVITNAWQLPWLVFAAANLQFLCFFGIAVFCSFCAGNRLTMAMIYTLINFGSFIAFWLVDTVYTPMLYGVVTPDALTEMLSPINHMVANQFVEIEHSMGQLQELFGARMAGAVTEFTLTEHWGALFGCAGAGLIFALIGLLLYKKRDLECAGDAVAFKILEPAFQIFGALVSAAAAQFFLYLFIGNDVNYLFLGAGLVVGWFGFRMLIERSTRVFRLKTFAGLAVLAAVLGLSLFATRMDFFGIERWQPKPEKVESATLNGFKVTDPQDIEKLLALQESALESRLENTGNYIQNEEGSWVIYYDQRLDVETLEELSKIPSRQAFRASICYTLDSGKEVTRRYQIWADVPAADGAREILTRWENVNHERLWQDGEYTDTPVLDVVLENPELIWVEGIEESRSITKEKAQELILAVQADCEAGTMAQNTLLHTGHFRRDNPHANEESSPYYYRPSISINLDNKIHGWYLDVYPECENTLAWLEKEGLLKWEVYHNSLCFY